MKRVIAFAVVFIYALALFAQPGHDKHKEKWERFRAEKIAFLTSRLDLTPAEAQEFWPVYNQLEKERWEAQKFRRQMEQKLVEAGEDISDKRIKELTREFAASHQKESELLIEYNEKFLEILSPKKVLTLYKAENEFRMHMIKKFRDRRKNNGH